MDFFLLTWCVCLPVNIVVLDGTHCGDAAYVCTKFVPSAASRRRLGICRRLYSGEVGSSTLPSMESHLVRALLSVLCAPLWSALELFHRNEQGAAIEWQYGNTACG
eukprot:SAG11_NODE_2946_length_2820_cov_2.023153_5_plen_106_part_00